jgi:hypothetical protein
MLTIITDDVTSQSCRILDAAGNDIGMKGITAIRIDLRAGEPNTASVELALIRTETAVGKVEWLAHNPLTDRMQPVTSITFADGTHVVLPEDATRPVIAPPRVIEAQTVGSDLVIKFRGSAA